MTKTRETISEKNETKNIDAPLNAWTWEYVINSRMILHIQLPHISFYCTIENGVFVHFKSNSFVHVFLFSVSFSFSFFYSHCFRPQVAAKIGYIKIVSGFDSKCIMLEYTRKYVLWTQFNFGSFFLLSLGRYFIEVLPRLWPVAIFISKHTLHFHSCNFRTNNVDVTNAHPKPSVPRKIHSNRCNSHSAY